MLETVPYVLIGLNDDEEDLDFKVYGEYCGPGYLHCFVSLLHSSPSFETISLMPAAVGAAARKLESNLASAILD